MDGLGDRLDAIVRGGAAPAAADPALIGAPSPIVPLPSEVAPMGVGTFPGWAGDLVKPRWSLTGNYLSSSPKGPRRF